MYVCMYVHRDTYARKSLLFNGGDGDLGPDDILSLSLSLFWNKGKGKHTLSDSNPDMFFAFALLFYPPLFSIFDPILTMNTLSDFYLPTEMNI